MIPFLLYEDKVIYFMKFTLLLAFLSAFYVATTVTLLPTRLLSCFEAEQIRRNWINSFPPIVQ